VVHGTLADAAYPSASFQAATLMEVIEHLSHPGDLLREVWRVLEPSGILVVGTGNAASWTVQFMRRPVELFSRQPSWRAHQLLHPRITRPLGDEVWVRIERLETRCVRFVESYQASPLVYRSLKILGEVLNPLARLLNRGDDMRAFLRKV